MSFLHRLTDRIRTLPLPGRTPRWPTEPEPPADDAHAPGHRHRGPPPREGRPRPPGTEPRRNQPWVRTSHSDSQRRRFRR